MKSTAPSANTTSAEEQSPFKGEEGSFQESLTRASGAVGPRTEKRKEEKEEKPVGAAASVVPVALPLPVDVTDVSLGDEDVAVTPLGTGEVCADGMKSNALPATEQRDVTAGDEGGNEFAPEEPQAPPIAPPPFAAEVIAPASVNPPDIGEDVKAPQPGGHAWKSGSETVAAMPAQAPVVGPVAAQGVSATTVVKGEADGLKAVPATTKVRGGAAEAMKMQGPSKAADGKANKAGTARPDVRSEEEGTKDKPEEAKRDASTEVTKDLAADAVVMQSVAQPAGNIVHAALDAGGAAVTLTAPASSAVGNHAAAVEVSTKPEVTSLHAVAGQGATPTDSAAGVLQSARLVQSVGQSEMRVAFRSPDLGSVSIHTSSTSDAVAARIAVDHTELAAMLTGQLPEMHARLGANHTVEVALTHGNGTGTSTSDQTAANRDGSSGSHSGGNTEADRRAPPAYGMPMQRAPDVFVASMQGPQRSGLGRLDVRV